MITTSTRAMIVSMTTEVASSFVNSVPTPLLSKPGVRYQRPNQTMTAAITTSHECLFLRSFAFTISDRRPCRIHRQALRHPRRNEVASSGNCIEVVWADRSEDELPGEASVAHRQDPACVRRDTGVVRDRDQRGAAVTERAQQVEHARGGGRVQSAGWFIGEHHDGVVDQGAADADSLQLTAGCFGDVAIFELRDPSLLHQFASAGSARGFRV